MNPRQMIAKADELAYGMLGADDTQKLARYAAIKLLLQAIGSRMELGDGAAALLAELQDDVDDMTFKDDWETGYARVSGKIAAFKVETGLVEA